MGSGDRLETGNTGAEHQHLRRLDRAGGGHEQWEEGRQSIGAHQSRAIPSDQSLGGERVHRLRAGDARQGVEGQSGCPGIAQRLDRLDILSR